MRPWAVAMEPHGVEVVLVALPRGKAERAVSVYRRAMEAHPGAAIGGHSFGGRVASMVAAEEKVTALVLLSYPLHAPGRPQEPRTSHWSSISCPVLLLSGENDQFARIDLLRDRVGLLGHGLLVTYPGLGHGLLPVAGDAAGRVAAFLATLETSGLA